MTGPLQLLLQRWQALQIDVRCALHASEPQRIQHYLVGGAKLARLGVFDEVGVLLHMTRTLLRAARDPELPSFWRSACFEQAPHPVHAMRGVLGPEDDAAMAAIEAAVHRCDPDFAVP